MSNIFIIFVKINFMIKKIVKIPIFYGKLIIIVTEDLTCLNDKFNIKVDKTYEAYSYNHITNQGNSEYYAVFRNRKIDIQTVVHECVHIANYIFRHNGMYGSIDDDECQAYLTSWIFKEIHKMLLRNTTF